MARAVQDAKIGTREARSRLPGVGSQIGVVSSRGCRSATASRAAGRVSRPAPVPGSCAAGFRRSTATASAWSA